MTSRRSASLPMVSAIDRLRVEGSRPSVRPLSPNNTPMSLSDSNLADIKEPPPDDPGSRETPLIPVVSITGDLKDITKQENPSANDAGSSTVVQRMRQMTRVKQIADGYHPEPYVSFTEPVEKTTEKKPPAFFLTGYPVTKDGDKKTTAGPGSYRSNAFSNLTKTHPLAHLVEQSDTVNHTPADIKGVKGAKGDNGDAHDVTNKSLQLPSLTFGSPHVTSACDYPLTGSMPSDRDDLVSHYGSAFSGAPDAPARSPDMDFRLLKLRRLMAEKSTGKESPIKEARPYSSQDLNHCLRINKTGNGRPSTGGDSLKLRHNTQFMQRSGVKTSNNPYQNMLNQSKVNKKYTNGPLFTSIESYLSFNKSKKEGRMQPVLMKTSGLVGQSLPNRAFSDTHLLRMIFEMNRPMSRSTSPLKFGESENMMNRDLKEYIRVNTPRLEPRTGVSRIGTKSARSFTTATVKEDPDE